MYSNRLEQQFLEAFSAPPWLLADSVRVPPMGLEQENPGVCFKAVPESLDLTQSPQNGD